MKLLVVAAVPLLAMGCGNPAARTAIPDSEARPDGHGRVINVEPGAEVGYRLTLDNGVVLEIGPPGTREIRQTTPGPDGLAVYGHDARGAWLLWLGSESRLGPDCFALRKLGYDRPGFVGWPDDGVALPKAAGFHVESWAYLDHDPQSQTFGWYTTGGESPGDPVFCVSSRAEVTSVSP